MSWHIDLDGEVALVIGGTRNIGLAIAEALQGAGAHIGIAGGSDREALERALARLQQKGAAFGALADVADEAAVAGLYDRVEQSLGSVSILVNSAGWRPSSPLTEISRRTWCSVLDVMLTGPFLAAREFFRRLPPDRRGAIVNLGGLSAYRPVKGRAHVIAAKAGVAGLTRALAEEGLGRIRVNCVVPGRIDTERRGGQPQAALGDDASHGRGNCEDVARVVVALSDPKDSYVTGQTVHVSGGRFMP
jgi:3-oxoacyl-[acyl-carrier protein] reductase